MDLRDLNTGEKVAGAAAAVLLVLMFFTWFSTPDIGEGVLGFDEEAAEQAQEAAEQLNDELGITTPDIPDVDVGFNAFQSFGFIDLLLLLTVIGGVGLAVTAATNTRPDLPVELSAIVTGIAVLAALLVLYRIINPPAELDRSIGVFLGFLATLGVAAGGWLAMQEEGASFGDAASQFGGGQGAPPAPPPGQAPPPPQQPPPPPPPPAAGGSQPPPPPPPPQGQ